jgi:hypothetical protein
VYACRESRAAVPRARRRIGKRTKKKAGDLILRQALDDTDGERRRQVTDLAMGYAERDITRRRVWVQQGGYDLEADQLPSIEQVLA